MKKGRSDLTPPTEGRVSFKLVTSLEVLQFPAAMPNGRTEPPLFLHPFMEQTPRAVTPPRKTPTPSPVHRHHSLANRNTSALSEFTDHTLWLWKDHTH